MLFLEFSLHSLRGLAFSCGEISPLFLALGDLAVQFPAFRIA